MLAIAGLGLAVVVYGFNFGRKPRPNTNDGVTGVLISSLGSALVGTGVGLLSRRPKLTASLAVAFAFLYLPVLSAALWTCIFAYSIWRAAFG